MHTEIDVMIMAGGKGKRLMPLTESIPKPLLKVGQKPIIAYNTDRLASYGIKNITISVNYLGEQIISYFEKNNKHQTNFTFIKENKPLGTIGALKLIKKFNSNYILVINSDLLTNIDYKAVFNRMLSNEADALIATSSYSITIPRDIVQTNNGFITDLKEKPSYTYHSNAGIYIFKKECLDYIPENTFFNATDLIKVLLEKGKKIVNYQISDYWLDIGKHEDFEKAQQDIKHINL